LTVEFTDSSTGAPDEWSWDFGDDTTSSDQNPSHTYQNTGLYTVSLKISKSGDTDKTTKVSYITVSGDANSVGIGATDAGPTPTLMKKSQLSGTAIPTPIIRQTPVQANVTAVLTGQAWLDRENKKLADAEAAAASQHPDIVSQIVGFFRGIFSWI
jgi:PKD repeat protein